MNILFAMPKYANCGEPYEMPLGLLYVASYVRSKGFKVFCLNTCNSTRSLEGQLSESICENEIDVICSGGLSLHYSAIGEIFSVAKGIKKDIITVAGGAIISSNPRLAMENMRIDFGIVGEGEETMAELASALLSSSDLRMINGLVYWDENHDLMKTDEREPISNLDLLPFPLYEEFDYGAYIELQSRLPYHFYTVFENVNETRPASIITSRSCPFNCTFCYHPLGKKYRQRTLDNVFEEIEYLTRHYDINLLFLIDELFSISRERLIEFAMRIKEYDIKWLPQQRVDDVDEETLRILKESGVIAIAYGIENVSDKILRSMKKNITRFSIERALKLTQEAKITTIGNILFGDPAETEDTIDETLTWWKNHLEYGLYLKMIITIPDSPLYQYAISKGLIKDELQHLKDGFPVINLTSLSDSRFKELSNFVFNYLDDEEYLLIGEVLQVRHEFKDKYGTDFFSIDVKCPECRLDSEYRQLTRCSTKTRALICKNCYKIIYVKTEIFEIGNGALEQEEAAHPIIVEEEAKSKDEKDNVNMRFFMGKLLRFIKSRFCRRMEKSQQ